MAHPNTVNGIRPLSEFRANAKAILAQLRRERRPIVLTQHGKGAAVLIAVEEYENLLGRLAELEAKNAEK